jgi:hypothetical protein
MDLGNLDVLQAGTAQLTDAIDIALGQLAGLAPFDSGQAVALRIRHILLMRAWLRMPRVMTSLIIAEVLDALAGRQLIAGENFVSVVTWLVV